VIRKRLAFVALVLLAGAVAWLAWGPSTPPPSPTVPATRVQPRDAGPLTAAAPLHPIETPSSEPSAPPPAAASPPAPRPATSFGRWRLVGTVAEPDGRPVDGASLRAFLEFDRRFDALGVARSGPDGSYAIDVSALAGRTFGNRDLHRILVRADAPRHGPTELEVALPQIDSSDRDEDVRGDVMLSPGAAVRGRLVDGDGKPPATGLVELLRTGPSGARGGDGVALGEDVVAGDGHFAIPIAYTGTYRLRAQARGAGVAFAGPLTLDPAADVDVGDLVLEAGPPIEGVVRYAGGGPAAGMGVHAVRQRDGIAGLAARIASTFTDDVSTTDQPVWSDHRGYWPTEDVEGHGGLREGWAATDASGRFRLSGLEPGTYELTVGLRAGELHHTGERDVRITIVRERWCRFRIRVQDEEGRALPRVELTGMPISNGPSDCVVLTSHDADDDGVVTIDLGVGDREGLSLYTDDYATDGPVIEGRDPDRVEDLTLVAKRRSVAARVDSDSGRIRLTILDDDGRRVSGIHGSLRRFGSQERVPVTTDGGDVTVAVPPGGWCLDAEVGDEPFDTYFPIQYGCINVGAGQEIPVERRAARGGRVRVTVSIPADSRERELIVTRLELASEKSIEYEWPFQSFWDPDARAWRPLSLLRPGVPAVLDRVVHAGARELRFAAQSFRPVAIPIVVAPGGTADVTIALEPD
jgi:hypothetical protein